jgi:uncharacterized membrane protein YczE
MGKRIAVLVAGWVLVAMAIVVLVRVRLGVAPYDVLNTAIANQFDIAAGTASWFACAALVMVAWLLGARPGVGTVVGAFVVGGWINAGLSVVDVVDQLPLRIALFAVALGVMYLGVCCIILSGVGAGPTELVTLGLMHRGAPIRVARWSVEGVCLAIGVVLGGSFGVGTVITLAVSGPVLAFLLPRVSRVLQLQISR